MNTLIILSTLATLTLSAPLDTTLSSQQSTDGSYKFYYVGPESARFEERKLDGAVEGYYAYVNPDGKLQTVRYVSGTSGYLPAGDGIPVPVEDVPEVVQARSLHLGVFKTVEQNLPALNADGLVPEVKPVPLTADEFLTAVAKSLSGSHLTFLEDTPEVVAAKAEHLLAQSKALGFDS